MKRKRAIGILATILLLLIGLGIYFSPPAKFVRYIGKQMALGKTYMDSLTDDDIQIWISRAELLLNEHYTDTSPGNTLVPTDLKELGILRIDVVPQDYVGFVWVGGIDHTELIIRREQDSTHTVLARYNDYEKRQLWPKDKSSQ